MKALLIARSHSPCPSPLLAVPADDVAEHLDGYIDTAMRRPVGIMRDGPTCAAMIPLNECARLLRRDRQAIRIEDLKGGMLEAILSAEPGERSKEAGRRLPDPAAG